MITKRIFPALVTVGALALFSAPAANAAYTTPPVEADVPATVAPGSTFEVSFSSDPVVCDWNSTFTLAEGSTGAPSSQSGPASNGTSYSATFQAPETGSGVVTATCGWDPDLYDDTPPVFAPSDAIGEAATPAFFSHSTKSAILQAAYQTQTYTYSVDTGIAPAGLDDDADGDGGDEASNVDDASDDAASGGSGSGGETNGLLPDTGGAQAAWLIAGLGLVAAGGAFTVAARRRKA